MNEWIKEWTKLLLIQQLIKGEGKYIYNVQKFLFMNVLKKMHHSLNKKY